MHILRFLNLSDVQLIAQGFLPTRGSLVLDSVFVAMFAICAVLMLSIGWVRFANRYRTHRKLQIGLAMILAVAILVFEVDVRFVTDWRKLAEGSKFYAGGTVDRALWIHLAFAIPTPLVWIYVVVQALRNFPKDPVPGKHSSNHRFWGWVATGMMWLTAVTGCVFYWLAFAC
jgi:putative membrane protein